MRTFILDGELVKAKTPEAAARQRDNDSAKFHSFHQGIAYYYGHGGHRRTLGIKEVFISNK